MSSCLRFCFRLCSWDICAKASRQLMERNQESPTCVNCRGLGSKHMPIMTRGGALCCGCVPCRWSTCEFRNNCGKQRPCITLKLKLKWMGRRGQERLSTTLTTRPIINALRATTMYAISNQRQRNKKRCQYRIGLIQVSVT